ncbi:hypothetical protein M8J77_006631 [Diaphorina citri]|nr:hypothetical protein M8J77_006631 [Diaphorina citri]
MSGLEPVCRRLTYQAGRCESVEQLPRCDLLRPSPQLWRFTTHTHTPGGGGARSHCALFAEPVLYVEGEPKTAAASSASSRRWLGRPRAAVWLARPPARPGVRGGSAKQIFAEL